MLGIFVRVPLLAIVQELWSARGLLFVPRLALGMDQER